MKYRNWMFLHFKRFTWAARSHANEDGVSKSYKKKRVSDLIPLFDRKKVSEANYNLETLQEVNLFKRICEGFFHRNN